VNWRLLDGTDVYGWPPADPRMQGVHIAHCMSNNGACSSLGASSVTTATRESTQAGTPPTCNRPHAQRYDSCMVHAAPRAPAPYRAWQRIRSLFGWWRGRPREAAGD
jgi:hypothetical protein